MEGHGIDFFEDKENALMAHEVTPENRLQNQIALASDLFLVFEQEGKKEDETDREYHNRIMTFWVEKGFSKAYHDIEADEEFGFHPRLAGDIYRITPEDVIYYTENGRLQEE